MSLSFIYSTLSVLYKQYIRPYRNTAIDPITPTIVAVIITFFIIIIINSNKIL